MGSIWQQLGLVCCWGLCPGKIYGHVRTNINFSFLTAPLESFSVNTQYSTQWHYSDSVQAIPYHILLKPSVWLDSNKYQFSSVWLNQGSNPPPSPREVSQGSYRPGCPVLLNAIGIQFRPSWDTVWIQLRPSWDSVRIRFDPNCYTVGIQLRPTWDTVKAWSGYNRCAFET